MLLHRLNLGWKFYYRIGCGVTRMIYKLSAHRHKNLLPIKTKMHQETMTTVASVAFERMNISKRIKTCEQTCLHRIQRRWSSEKVSEKFLGKIVPGRSPGKRRPSLFGPSHRSRIRESSFGCRWDRTDPGWFRGRSTSSWTLWWGPSARANPGKALRDNKAGKISQFSEQLRSSNERGSMGSHHHQVAALVPDEKLCVLNFNAGIFSQQN